MQKKSSSQFFRFGVKIVKKTEKSTEPFSHTYVKSEAMSGYKNNLTTLNHYLRPGSSTHIGTHSFYQPKFRLVEWFNLSFDQTTEKAHPSKNQD